MEIIIRSGNKSSRLKDRYNNLNSYVNKELTGPSPIKGAVYDFNEWSQSKIKSNNLGNDRNGLRMKERDEIKRDLIKKGEQL